LSEENVTSRGRFHSFENTTTLPRPTQKRLQFFIAANTTESSYEYAGENGYYIMAIPMVAAQLKSHLAIYRNAWKKAGHPGEGKVFLAFHMFVDPDSARARRIAGAEVESYFKSIIRATAGMDTVKSKDYVGYEKQREMFSKFTIDSLIENCAAWVGSPAEVCSQIERYSEACGGFDYASLQVNFHMLAATEALRSIELFANDVMPRFGSAPVPA
jgi:alkanesulfonate monooxygenase SsuD/methylene tetrahydromethanopterin reductase-like flavin-dependent oxidoreductase (luciferase family)